MGFFAIVILIAFIWWAIASFNRQTTFNQDAAKTVISIILLQLNDPNKLPAKAKDSYSLGYITGMVEASTVGKIENDENRQTLKFVLKQVFGNAEASKLFLNCLECIQLRDNTFYTAMSDGGTEFDSFIGGKILAPRGWSQYIYGYSNPLI